MSGNPENFSNYSFSEYAQPAQPGKVDYTDPRFYQNGHTPQPAPTLPLDSASYPPNPDAYETLPMSEYQGPTSLENYTADAGAVQRDAAQHGNADAAAKRKNWLAELGGVGTALGVMFKFGLASLTAVVSVVVYAQLFGWAFGIGLVVLLFIHEMGHAVVMKLKGIPIGGLIFVPMLGAAVIMRRMPGTAKDEAEVGIAGPVAGAFASLICLFLAFANPSQPGFPNIWASLAYFGFFLNLFNLIPIIPFDGGRVVGAIDRRVWLLGFITLLAIQIWQWLSGNFSIWLLIFVILAATQLLTRGRAPATPDVQAYYAQTRSERLIIGLAYFALIAFLALGMTAAHSMMVLPQ